MFRSSISPIGDARMMSTPSGFRIVAFTDSNHFPGSRLESTTFALGYFAIRARQCVHAGQSTVDRYPSNARSHNCSPPPIRSQIVTRSGFGSTSAM
jgi:hypothetical protein